MTRLLRALEVPDGPALLEILPRLSDALHGLGPAWLPVPAHDPRETARLTTALMPDEPIDDAVALVVATSGTTGTPKGAMLPGTALLAGARATHDRLGGPGSWLLPLAGHHIAGLQVLVRSIVAGTEPVVLDVSTGFDPLLLPAAIAALPSGRRYTSLVPTQLVKVLDEPAAVEALAALDAILVGGAATPPQLQARASAAGLRLVRTYGMSETCGGCVYDGVPLAGVEVRLEPTSGRVLLGGNVLAAGYRGQPEHPAFAEPGWFRTDDFGTFSDGTLTVLGRLDEAISTGGLTVVPQVVEAALARVPGVRECAVFGLPDVRLGERVVAAVVPEPATEVTLELIRGALAAELPATAAPRELFLLDALPLRGPGKVDRRALVARFS